MSKKIIVDIDNTLWDFHNVMEDKIFQKFGKKTKDTCDKIQWNSWVSLMDLDTFLELCLSIHMKQYIYEPYPEAENFLMALKDLGFYIILASHRDIKSSNSTKMFLRNNNFVYDELVIGWDKTVLFERLDIKAIVDDCPSTLEKAKEKNILCTGLKFDYNNHVDVPLFNNLNDVLTFIKNECI